MTEPLDRLYNLLPYVYRQQDEAQGGPLKALLQVITEQVNAVEDDIDQLYDNWFIETCQDWVVPYIGDLVGYTPVHEAGEPGDVRTPRERRFNKILIPRRDVAKTIQYRRRKGALALLELLANDVAGWPARAVEFYKLLGVTQSLNHLQTARGCALDLRQGDQLDRLGGPFDELAHSVDVRRINSTTTPGRYNITSVGVFVFRLKEYSVTDAPACCVEASAPHRYSFSVLGNDTPLYARKLPEPGPDHIAEENLPVPIRLRAFERNKERYYGAGKSFQISVIPTEKTEFEPVKVENIIPADLSDWKKYHIHKPGFVAVDPVCGRILFPPGDPPEDVRVSYYYSFSADIGGGEYSRPILNPFEPAGQEGKFKLYSIGEKEELKTIESALDLWKGDNKNGEHPHAAIEIVDNRVYSEQITISLKKGESLQIRAANFKRPTLYLLDWRKPRPDMFKVKSKEGGCLSLDGLLITGRGVHVEGEIDAVNIRHCTLVPGWVMLSDNDQDDHDTTPPSLELYGSHVRCNIEHSILGPIRVYHNNVLDDPLRISLSDSILDATNIGSEAISDIEGSIAHAALTITRCTVFSKVLTHSIELAEDSLFMSPVTVARRQIGCMRFCYEPSRNHTPRRYHCLPDLAIAESNVDPDSEQLRVQPQFNSTLYGTPDYCQLANACAVEIKRGASDQSEIGAFHDLYQPQRAANLRTRLDEYTPAGMNTGIIFAS